MGALRVTEPLTSADCDLRDFAFMPMDIVRLFGSRFHAIASDSEWRAGVTLWLKSFHQVPSGSLPDDDIELCRLAELGRDVKAWRKLRENALHGWIKCSDGRFYHPVVSEKANEAWAKKQAQRERSRRGNAARWGSRVDHPDESGLRAASQKDRAADASMVAQAVPQASLKDSNKDPSKESLKDSHEDSRKDPKGQGQGQGVLKDGLPSASLQVVGAQTGDAGPEPPQEPAAESDPEGAMPPGVPPCPHQSILALWAEVLPQLPQHRIWTKTRAAHLQARWRETAVQRSWREQQDGLEYFRRLFAYVGKSRFLTGNAPPSRAGQPPFVCELEWLLLPSNWAKVIEGKYHQEAA